MDSFDTRMARRPRRTPAPRPARRAPRDLDMSDVLRDAEEMREREDEAARLDASAARANGTFDSEMSAMLAPIGLSYEQGTLFESEATGLVWRKSVATGGWFTYSMPGVKIVMLPGYRQIPPTYIVERLDDDHLPIDGSGVTFRSIEAALDSLKES